MEKNIILSFTLSGHGFSGVLCINGEIIGATTLERLTREKNDIFLPISKIDLAQFGWKNEPSNYKDNLDLKFDFINDYSNINFDQEEKFHLLLNYLLEMGNISLKEVNCVVYSYRHIESARKFFAEKNPNIEFIVPDHHFSHACQAFLPSPFDEAAIMIVDGQGVPMERTSGDPLSGCLAYGNKNKIEILNELSVRQSLGGIYAAFTKIIGFETNQEGKTMGLAPYGTDRYYEILKQEIKFDAKYYNIRNIKELIKRKFEPTTDLYKLPQYSKFLKKFNRRLKNDKITDVDRDLAYAVQKITEDVMIYLADWLHDKTGSNNLCIAGGVGLNCVANYQVLVKSKFKNIFIHPNPGDNGLAVGQALYVYNILNNNDRKYIATTDSLGKKYEESVIKDIIDKYRNRSDIVIEEFFDLKKMYESLADSISLGKITSWFQGRSEFGPRALGNRSIIADPRRKDMKDILNSRVKFRESFRPFTPSVLAEKATEFFELDVESPFMLLACYVKKGKAELVPAITHVDNTARVQTVTKEINDRYYDLIKEFEKKTSIPMVLETSFNINGEPIVETPEDAIKCFLSTDIDVLCIDKYIIRKNI
jgi:carbamoyltransferase